MAPFFAHTASAPAERALPEKPTVVRWVSDANCVESSNTRDAVPAARDRLSRARPIPRAATAAIRTSRRIARRRAILAALGNHSGERIHSEILRERRGGFPRAVQQRRGRGRRRPARAECQAPMKTGKRTIELPLTRAAHAHRAILGLDLREDHGRGQQRQSGRIQRRIGIGLRRRAAHRYSQGAQLPLRIADALRARRPPCAGNRPAVRTRTAGVRTIGIQRDRSSERVMEVRRAAGMYESRRRGRKESGASLE